QEMATNNFNYFEIGNMQEYMFSSFITTFMLYTLYTLQMDDNKFFKNLVMNSKNESKTMIFPNTNMQSAENSKGFSETMRQSNNNLNSPNTDPKFWSWLAGMMDGDGYVQVMNMNGNLKTKTIEVKLHNRDIRILTRMLDKLHMGRMYRYKNHPYSKWIVSTTDEMTFILNKLNGLMRLKVENFKKGCDCMNIKFQEADYNMSMYDPYFSGLIDTDGSIVFNYSGNRMECNLELKYNIYSSKTCLDNVIPNYQPSRLMRLHKQYSSMSFKFQTVKGMVFLYDYFMKNRLYSDFKFYRVTQMLRFIEIRDYQKLPYSSEEFLIYSEWLLNWIQYKNPKWYKVPFMNKLRLKR
uniref:LAGLIDADG endonuclease n=1 Tax=Saccharomycopsis fibuligera TaxID=4944 RepID=UPI002A8079AD